MYKRKNIAVIIPAHNEANQIEKVIQSMPDYVDKMVIIDDKSKDKTVDLIKRCQGNNDKIVLIQHTKNQGVGGAIATGYKWTKNNKVDIAVVMAGDGQMDPDDLPNILDPIITGEVDYTKGNRLFTGEAYRKIPNIRYFGNSILSLLTKIASGYWHIADSQSGYTAMNKKVLNTIDWDKMYKRYGQPNDLLVRLNIYNFKVKDVPINPVYNRGEKSGIKLNKVIFSMSWLLLKLFLWRLKEKYIIRDFHPLIFFYFIGFIFSVGTITLFLRLSYLWIMNGRIPPINALATVFCFMSAALFTLFAMWFDMENNKDLK